MNWILHIRTYWCKILLDCLHDALHGAGLDDDDEVNQLEGEEPRFQHLLLDLLDFYLLQTDARCSCLILKRTPGHVSMSWSIDDDNHLFNKRHTRPPSTAARCSGFSQCYELLGMHELTLKLKPFFHTSHIIFLISWKSIRVLLELKYT